MPFVNTVQCGDASGLYYCIRNHALGTYLSNIQASILLGTVKLTCAQLNGYAFNQNTSFKWHNIYYTGVIEIP